MRWTHSLMICSMTFSTPMISLPNPTKPPTSPSLTNSQRSRVRELIAERWLDGMEFCDLAEFFRDTQIDYLGEWSDAELIDEVGDLTSDEEYQEILMEIVE